MSGPAWGLLPLAMDESDCLMILLSLFLLIVLVIVLFLVFPLEFALLLSAGIALAFIYALYETRRIAQMSEVD